MSTPLKECTLKVSNISSSFVTIQKSVYVPAQLYNRPNNSWASGPNLSVTVK